MRIDHHELVKEVSELTTVEGFVSACLDLKESMLFYDRDLMLAAYSSTLELLVVSALFCAHLETEAVAREVEEELESKIQGLMGELVANSLPLDVQNLVEHFVKGPGFVILQRWPVYQETFWRYRTDDYFQGPETDRLIDQVQQHLYARQWDQAKHLMGYVGARMLRGDHLRSFWFRIGHPRLQVWLSGLQTAVNNFSVAPYFNFPFDDIATERQKRTKVSGNVVVDLSAFRNFRRGIGGYTDRRIIIEPDNIDEILEQLFSSTPVEAINQEIAEDDRTLLRPLLRSVIRSKICGGDVATEYVEKALLLLQSWKCREAAELAVELLDKLDPWDSLFESCLAVLKDLGPQAVSAIRRFVRSNQSSPLQPVIAEALSQSRPSKRVFGLLTEMFERSQWGNGKELLCKPLVRFAGKQAEPILQDALRELGEGEDSGSYREQVKSALKMAAQNKRGRK